MWIQKKDGRNNKLLGKPMKKNTPSMTRFGDSMHKIQQTQLELGFQIRHKRSPLNEWKEWIEAYIIHPYSLDGIK